MASDPVDYRLEKYASMGYDHMRALILTHSRDTAGVHVYWRSVQEAVQCIGLDRAYDLFAADLAPAG